MSVSRFLKLNTGAKMPVLGYGTYLSKEDTLSAALDCALHTGYRHIDTAYRYGNHKAIGRVLADWMKDGKIKREDVFITTKIPGNLTVGDGIKLTLEESLEDLQLPYVDMLLMHTPFGYGPLNEKGEVRELVDTDIIGAWKAMEEMFHENKTKAIGVSNFSRSQMDRIIVKGKIEIANLQTECHVYYQQRELRKYCLQMGIAVTGYAPLGAPGCPPRVMQTTEAGSDPPPPPLLENPVILNIAKTMAKTPAQILLRYLLQLGVAPMPKSVSPQRIQENFDVFDFKLDEENMNLIKTLNMDKKIFVFPHALNHKEYPKNEPF